MPRAARSRRSSARSCLRRRPDRRASRGTPRARPPRGRALRSRRRDRALAHRRWRRGRRAPRRSPPAPGRSSGGCRTAAPPVGAIPRNPAMMRVTAPVSAEVGRIARPTTIGSGLGGRRGGRRFRRPASQQHDRSDDERATEYLHHRDAVPERQTDQRREHHHQVDIDGCSGGGHAAGRRVPEHVRPDRRKHHDVADAHAQLAESSGQVTPLISANGVSRATAIAACTVVAVIGGTSWMRRPTRV